MAELDRMIVLDEMGFIDERGWKVVPGRGYRTRMCLPELKKVKGLWERWQNAFLLWLPPQARLHRHVDTREPYQTFHIPIMTNYRAFNCFEIDGQDVAMHLERGWIYSFDRTIPHWAVNGGSTDRIHLLCEVFS